MHHLLSSAITPIAATDSARSPHPVQPRVQFGSVTHTVIDGLLELSLPTTEAKAEAEAGMHVEPNAVAGYSKAMAMCDEEDEGKADALDKSDNQQVCI